MNKNAQFLSKCIFVRYDGVNPVVVNPEMTRLCAM